MQEKPPNIALAALWMTGSIASFSAMAVAGRVVSVQHDTFEIMLFRSLTGVAIMVAFLTLTNRWRQISRANLPTHGLRNLMHFTGQNLWFYAVGVIPLAQVFALEFTSPIWVVILSPFLLGERMTRPRVIAALMGFIGIMVIARPGATTLNAGVLCAAGSAFFFALTNILTKRLTRQHQTATILFWLTLMQAGMGLIAAGYDGQITLPDAQTLPWLLLIGGAGLLAHLCLTNALAVAPATVVIPIDFARLPTIAVIGMLFFSEPLDMLVLLGAVIIFAGNYINIKNTKT